MVIVVAGSYAKQEHLERYLTLYKELVEETNAKDKGCLRYELCRDKDNPLHFAMLEEWESMDDLNAHLEAEHIKRRGPLLAKCRSGDSEITVFNKVF